MPSTNLIAQYLQEQYPRMRYLLYNKWDLMNLLLIAESAKRIPELENVCGQKGAEQSRTPVEIKSGDWSLKVVPWIGGRIISIEHLHSKTQWLHSGVDMNGYEEYSGMENRSGGCSEEYSVIERGEVESLQLEGYIGGGLVLERQIYIPNKDNFKNSKSIPAL